MSLFTCIASAILKLPPRRSARIAVEFSMQAPMRDGAVLLADRWYPTDMSNAPVVLMRSPYGRSALFGNMAQLIAERGFQVVMQSCRGTFGSGGDLDPMRQEGEDGADAVAWIRQQPWFTGKLYTFGGSYIGNTQWALAKAAEDVLDGMVLQVTLSNFKDETLGGGGFTQESSLAWTTLMKTQMPPPSLGQRLFNPRPKVDMAKVHAHLPLRDLDRLATGQEVSWWQDWIAHDDPKNPWWDKIDHSRDVAEINAPAAMIGGWKDIFLPAQIRDFAAMQAKGRDVWLTIGPWYHASPSGMTESVRQAIEFFSARANGVQPFPNRDRVRLYVSGAEEWRDYSAWPPLGSREQRLFLHEAGKLSAASPASASNPTSFVYDPSDPTPSLHGPRLFPDGKKPDMSALEKRGDTVSFTTAPLTADVELIGPAKAELFVRSDRGHTDFYVCLCDVDTAGRPMHVLDGYIRLRPGDALPDENGVMRVEIECWPTAYRFKRGHALRLIVASGAHPRYARNLGTGEPLATAIRMVPARQEILHGFAYPSALCVTLGGANDSLPC